MTKKRSFKQPDPNALIMKYMFSTFVKIFFLFTYGSGTMLQCKGRCQRKLRLFYCLCFPLKKYISGANVGPDAVVVGIDSNKGNVSQCPLINISVN